MKQTMSNVSDVFVERCSAAKLDPRLCAAVRQAVARLVKVDPQSVEWDTPQQEIVRAANSARIDGWDNSAFLFELEDVLDCEIDRDDFEMPPFCDARFLFWYMSGPTTFGEWLMRLVPYLSACGPWRNPGGR